MTRHRDIILPGPFAQLTIGVPLTPLVANNGPLALRPGSHVMDSPGYEVVTNIPHGSIMLYVPSQTARKAFKPSSSFSYQKYYVPIILVWTWHKILPPGSLTIPTYHKHLIAQLPAKTQLQYEPHTQGLVRGPPGRGASWSRGSNNARSLTRGCSLRAFGLLEGEGPSLNTPILPAFWSWAGP